MKFHNIRKAPLPEEYDPQRRNRKVYLAFAAYGAASFAICGESLLVLIAIHFGFGDTFCSVLGAFLYLSYLVLPAGYYFAAGIGVARSIAFQTMITVLGSCLMFLAVLVFPQSGRTAGILLTAGTVLFFFAKSSGSAMLLPLQANISDDRNRPRMLGKIAACSNIAALLTTLAIALILHLFESSWSYPVLLGGGSLLGMLSALSILKIREPPVLRKIAGYPVLQQILLGWREPIIRKQLALGCYLNLSLIMLIPVEMLMVKQGMGLTDAQVTTLWAVKVTASIAAAPVWSFLTQRFGSSKVCAGAILLIPLLCLFWGLTPLPQLENLVFLPFLTSGVMIVFYSNSLLDFFMKSVKSYKQQGGALLVMVITGGVAGLLGIGLNALLFEILEKFLAIQENTQEFYRSYFLIAAVLFLAQLCNPGLSRTLREFQ